MSTTLVTHHCPTGVILHDERTDELVTDKTVFLLADGSVLRLRLARGRIVDGDTGDHEGSP